MQDSEQLDIVESIFPPSLSVIEASAGTGKTFAISHLVPRLLLDKAAENLGEILLVTFTNDAARELAERVRRVLELLATDPTDEEEKNHPGVHRLRQGYCGDEHREILKRALIDIDRLNVSTIHSFCQRTIQAEGTLCGLPVMPEVITNADELIDEALYEIWQEEIVGDPFLAAMAQAYGWSLGDDLRVVRRACTLEDYEALPAAGDFKTTVDAVKNAPAALTDAMVRDLEGFIDRVPTWNGGGKDEATRLDFIQSIKGATSYLSPGFSEAIQWVSKLGDHISGRSAVGKKLKVDAHTLEIVKAIQGIQALVSRLRWDWQNSCVASVRKRVQVDLRKNRQITQDGMILTLRNALRSETGKVLAQRLRDQYRVGLIDESQDTDPRQFEIFKSVFVGFNGKQPLSTHRLVMIGDPKQAIYGFRGADVNTYLQARNQAAKVYTLIKTFRAPKALVEAINAFFRRDQALLKEGLAFHPAESGQDGDTHLYLDGQPCEGRIEAWIVPDSSEVCRTSAARKDCVVSTVASEIVRLLKGGEIRSGSSKVARVQPKDIAVLTFSNAEAEAMATALRERGVPAVVASGADVMATEEAGELLRILRALNEPRRSGLRYSALATRLLGFDSGRIQVIQNDPGQDDEILGKFDQWQLCWERKGIAAALARMDGNEGITVRLASLESGERRVTNFRQLVDLLQAASQEHSGRPEHLLRWFEQEIGRAGDQVAADERQMQLESDSAAVQVVTMHKAKGLEYPLVFVPFLWNSHPGDGIRVLASENPGSKDTLVNQACADAAVTSVLTQTAFEDRLRLAYVAMTRAKVRLWVFGGEMGNGRGLVSAHPLDWLLRDPSVKVTSPEEFVAWADAAADAGRGSRHRDGLQALFQGESEKLLLVKEPPAPSLEISSPSNGPDVAAFSALPAPTIPPVWSVTSFSSLTREAHPHGVKDLVPSPPAPVGAGVSNSAGGFNSFNQVPGGMLLGTAVHEWLQEWDFDEPDARLVQAHLGHYRLATPSSLTALSTDESMTSMLRALRDAILPGMNCAIADACGSHEGAEWHFQLPIHDKLSVSRIAEAFAKHSAPEHAPYTALLAALNAQELYGFLQGFLDRLAFKGNQWGVIDWKTNKLGEEEDSYSQDSMLRCAMESHYLLQVHLYIVALRRYLRAAVPEATIAGGWLVFLRAVSAGTDLGILHIRPPDPLLDALDQLFFVPEEALV